MRAIDTNALVRLITRDDARQSAAADAFVAHGAWVPHLVVVEATWVLEAVYGFDPTRIATALEMLLDHHELMLQDADAIAAALATYRRRPTLGFSDCLIVALARKAGHLPLGTFDRTLGRIDGAHRL